MEINVEQSKLAKALSIVSRITGGSRTTLPILNNVLMEVKDNKVTLVTTNLDMAINYYLPTTLAKDGKITVPAKLLADFVSNLPKGEVKIQVNQEKLTVSEGKYKSVFNGNAAEDFPELPEFDEKSAISFQMGIDEFRLGMNAVKIACSSDTTRPTLTGIYFNSSEGGLYVAATDGYRLAEKKLINKIESEIKAIVPVQCITDVLGAISDNMENIEILFDEFQVRFRLGEIEIISKLIDGAFPDYRKLIPEKSQVEILLNKAELLRGVKLAALFSRATSGSIVCESKKDEQVFVVSSVLNEFGENKSEIEAEISNDAKVVLNSKYLNDVLLVLDEDELKFGISGKLSPVLIQNKNSFDYTHIIMPLKS